MEIDELQLEKTINETFDLAISFGLEKTTAVEQLMFMQMLRQIARDSFDLAQQASSRPIRELSRKFSR